MRVLKCGSSDLRFVVALSGEFTSGISINVALIIASIAFYRGIVAVGTVGNLQQRPRGSDFVIRLYRVNFIIFTQDFSELSQYIKIENKNCKKPRVTNSATYNLCNFI